MLPIGIRRRIRAARRRLRESRMVALAFKSGRHPVLAQLVATRSGEPPDVSLVSDLGESGGSNIAREKDVAVGEAAAWVRERGR